MKKFNFTKNGFTIKKAISCFASMAVLLAQLPQIQVRAEATPFTDTTTGINFSVDNNVYTVADEQTVSDGSKYVGIKYTLNDNTFSASKVNNSISGEKIILGSIDGHSVTSIGNDAFYQCSGLTSITIPSGVTSIGKQAFYRTGLTSVSLPSSVTSIGKEAFGECSGITSLPDLSHVTSFGESIFKGCGFTSITIPNYLTQIPAEMFSQCNNLTSVTIPSSVTSNGFGVFANCSNLSSVTISSGVTSIGEGEFTGTTSLTSISIPSSVTSIGALALGGSGLTSITIPDGVTSVGDLAFSSCAALTQVDIPGSVTSIGACAFMESGLESVTIPEGVTSIGGAAFAVCGNLTSISLPNSIETLTGGFTIENSQLRALFMGVDELGVFCASMGLTSITLPCNKVALLSAAGLTVSEDGTSFTNAFEEQETVGTLTFIHDLGWTTDNSGNETVYKYGCKNCNTDEKIIGSITIEGAIEVQGEEHDIIEMAKGSQKLVVARKNPSSSMTLTWSSADESKVTLSRNGSRDNEYNLTTAENATGDVNITVAATETNGPQKIFTLRIKPFAGTITNNSYPQNFFFTGQSIKNPGTCFDKNLGNPESLSYEWYQGTKAEGTPVATGETTPTSVGDYVLKVILPGSENYARSEYTIPVKIKKLNVNVADGDQGLLSMQASQLNVQRWEKADSKDAETFDEISGSNSATYTPGDDDYGKYIRVVTKDEEQHEVVSEPVLVKFVKNSISFK